MIFTGTILEVTLSYSIREQKLFKLGVIHTPNTVYVIECGKFTRVDCRMAKGRN